MEGPFGDHYGYYGRAHPFPVFHCQKIYHRKNAIYPATVVGKPIQEDLFIGQYLQKLLSPLIPLVIPAVKSLWSYGETGFHPLAAAIIKESYEREALSTAFRILGEGQLSLTKFLLITDQPIDLSDSKTLLETVLARFRPDVDLFIFANTSNDTLDYTGPKLNHGSKAILLGLGEEKRTLPDYFRGTLPRPISKARAFCKGCLVLQAPSYETFQDVSQLLEHIDFAPWPFLILVDDLEATCSSTLEFLWSVFTRFEPAGDMFSAHMHVKRHHITYSIPILIDARMKPSYPQEAIVDDATKKLVDKRWTEYAIGV
jgi:3-polyprenyl-4-hydroxybenzoate decarboxylase